MDGSFILQKIIVSVKMMLCSIMKSLLNIIKTMAEHTNQRLFESTRD